MAHRKDPAPPNPLKEQGRSKRTTKETADKAPVGPGRPDATDEEMSTADRVRRFESGEQADKGALSRDAATGPWAREKQAASSAQRGQSPGATNIHPGQHGGVRAGDPESDPQNEGKPSGVKRGPSPRDEPSSQRTGTDPSPPRGPEGRSRRTGRTSNDRHSPRR